MRLWLHPELKFAADIGLDNVILEGDSMVVTQVLKTKDVGLAAYGLLIRDACTLARNFLEVSYSHTKREGNKVAHCLAKLVANLAMCNLDGRSSSYHLSSCSG